MSSPMEGMRVDDIERFEESNREELKSDRVPDEALVRQGEKVDSYDESVHVPKSTGSSDSSTSLVTSFFKAQPFLFLFIRYAKCQYWHLKGDRKRIDAHARRHPRFFKLCRFGDYLLTAFLVLTLTAIIGAVAVKLWIGVFV